MPDDPAQIAATELADVYAGERRQAQDGRVLAFTRDAVRHGEALRRRTGAAFGVELADFSAAALDALEEQIDADRDLLEAEGLAILGSSTRANRVHVEVATARPAETVAWLYERYGGALVVDVAAADVYEEALAPCTAYREADGGIELRYARGGELLRVEVVEEDDVVAAGIVERRRIGQDLIYREAWALAALRAPLGARRVRDAVSGRSLS